MVFFLQISPLQLEELWVVGPLLHLVQFPPPLWKGHSPWTAWDKFTSVTVNWTGFLKPWFSEHSLCQNIWSIDSRQSPLEWEAVTSHMWHKSIQCHLSKTDQTKDEFITGTRFHETLHKGTTNVISIFPFWMITKASVDLQERKIPNLHREWLKSLKTTMEKQHKLEGALLLRMGWMWQSVKRIEARPNRGMEQMAVNC